jgi:hypothetical protein
MISCSILFRIRNVSENTVQKIKTHWGCLRLPTDYGNLEYMIMYIVWNVGQGSSIQHRDYLWAGRFGGSNPDRGEIFRTCPDRPWEPPSFLYNGYQVCFPEVKWPDHGHYHPSHLLLRLKKEYSYTSTLSGSSWPVIEWTLPFPLPFT